MITLWIDRDGRVMGLDTDAADLFKMAREVTFRTGREAGLGREGYAEVEVVFPFVRVAIADERPA